MENILKYIKLTDINIKLHYYIIFLLIILYCYAFTHTLFLI